MNPSVAEQRERTAGQDHSPLTTHHSALILVRRFLVLAALMFWQGGFTFYAAVVVPIGTAQLGGATEQGFITRHVAWYLNLVGAVALGFLFMLSGPWWKVPAPWTAHATTTALWVRFLLQFLWPRTITENTLRRGFAPPEEESSGGI